MTVTIGRRELLAALGSAAAARPLAVRAQQPERMRRIGVLIGLEETDTEVGKYLSELRKTLRALGWIEGKNLWIDHRAALDLDGMRLHALDLVNLGAELVVTYATPATDAVRQAVRRLQRDRSILYFRGAAAGYCLWPHTSVNLERAYHDACKALPEPTRVGPLIRESLETRPLVARRHYIETGNLRHFTVHYAPVQ